MTFLWFVTGAALIAALVAWRQARATARRLEQLTQMYWELRYQHGELRVKVQRLSGDETPASPEAPSSQTGVPPGFVPLSSLKR
jgi:hypothetical protein